MPRPRKREGSRQITRRFIIFCEGSADKSESAYFKGLIKQLPQRKKNVDVRVEDTKENTGKELVKKAKIEKLRDDDCVWVVYDKDGYTQHAQTFNEAAANDVEIAFSSICFEYWILLHFVFTTAPDRKCDCVENKIRKEKEAAWYTKKSIDMFEKLKDKLGTAVSNARKARANVLATHRDDTPRYDLNPYTDIDKLIENLTHFVVENSTDTTVLLDELKKIFALC